MGGWVAGWVDGRKAFAFLLAVMRCALAERLRTIRRDDAARRTQDKTGIARRQPAERHLEATGARPSLKGQEKQNTADTNARDRQIQSQAKARDRAVPGRSCGSPSPAPLGGSSAGRSVAAQVPSTDLEVHGCCRVVPPRANWN